MTSGWPTSRRHDSIGDRLCARRHGHPRAISRAIRVPRGIVDRSIAGAFLHDPQLIEHDGLRPEQGDDRLDDGEINHLTAAPSSVALVQAGEDRRGRGQRCNSICQPERRQRRRAVGLACDVGKAAHRFRQGPETRPLGIRAELPESCDAGDDDAGVHFEESTRSEIPTLQRARAEVLDEHVGPLDQSKKQVLAFHRLS